MSDMMQGGVHPFPERTQVFRRDRKMTTADEIIRNADDWRIYVLEDTVQAQIDAAREAALVEAADMLDKKHRGDLPKHIMSESGNWVRALIRKGDQP